MSGVMMISRSELEADYHHLPSYRACDTTDMRAYKWRSCRVTVREGCRSTQARELRVLSQLAHPQLLLRMGQTDDLRVMFEPVMVGSLYICLHHLKVRHVNQTRKHLTFAIRQKFPKFFLQKHKECGKKYSKTQNHSLQTK